MGFDLVRNGAACPEPWLLLDHCEEVVAVTDHAFRLIYINDRESDLAPSGIAQLAGQVVWDVFPESVGNLFETGLRQAVATRQPWVMIADFPSAGRFLIRGFPHSNNLFALFLRRRIGRRTAARVRGKTAPYPEPENPLSSKQLEAALRERETAVREVEQRRQFQRRLITEVLANVTEGRLRLCSRESDLPTLLPAVGETIFLSTPRMLAPFRRHIEVVGAILGLPEGRTQELMIAAGEAAMNGIVHAGGGMATFHGVPGGAQMQICVADAGSGIADENLHRATLERGYTTAGSLGLGFSLMHSVADRVHLFTSPSGTTVVLEQGAVPKSEEETRFR